MMLKQGLQEVLLKGTPTSSGVSVKDFSIQSDAVLIVVWVTATSGSIDISVANILDDGNKESALITFPTITAPTPTLLQKRSAASTTRLRLRVTYTGSCDFEISARAISTGSGDTRILGASSLQMLQKNVSIPHTVLVSASTKDRSAIAIKNNSTSGTIYIAETIAKTTIAKGWPVGPKDALGLDVQAGVELYAVSDGPVCDIRIIESGAE
jgi:hypothetical protein